MHCLQGNGQSPATQHTKSTKDTGYNPCFSSTSCVNYEGRTRRSRLRLKRRWVPSKWTGPTCIFRESLFLENSSFSELRLPQKLCYLTRSNLSSRSRQTEHSRLLTSTHQGHAQGKTKSTQTNGRSSIHTGVCKALLRRKRRTHARRGNSR